MTAAPLSAVGMRGTNARWDCLDRDYRDYTRHCDCLIWYYTHSTDTLIGISIFWCNNEELHRFCT